MASYTLTDLLLFSAGAILVNYISLYVLIIKIAQLKSCL